MFHLKLQSAQRKMLGGGGEPLEYLYTSHYELLCGHPYPYMQFFLQYKLKTEVKLCNNQYEI